MLIASNKCMGVPALWLVTGDCGCCAWSVPVPVIVIVVILIVAP